MNRYYCVKCNKQVVIRSTLKELAVKCCDGDKATKHVIGNAPKPHVPKVVVEKPVQKEKILSNPNPPAKPLTKLDQPAGDIKLPVNAPAPESAKPEDVVKASIAATASTVISAKQST